MNPDQDLTVRVLREEDEEERRRWNQEQVTYLDTLLRVAADGHWADEIAVRPNAQGWIFRPATLHCLASRSILPFALTRGERLALQGAAGAILVGRSKRLKSFWFSEPESFLWTLHAFRVGGSAEQSEKEGNSP